MSDFMDFSGEPWYKAYPIFFLLLVIIVVSIPFALIAEMFQKEKE